MLRYNAISLFLNQNFQIYTFSCISHQKSYLEYIPQVRKGGYSNGTSVQPLIMEVNPLRPPPLPPTLHRVYHVYYKTLFSLTCDVYLFLKIFLAFFLFLFFFY